MPRGFIRERFQTTLFPVTGGAWWTFATSLRVYNLTIIPRLWLLHLKHWRSSNAKKSFIEFLDDLRKYRGAIFFLFHPLKTHSFGLYRVTAIRWAYPKFEITLRIQSVTNFMRSDSYITAPGINFLLFEKTERMFRNFGNQGRGNAPYTGPVSGANSLGNTGTSTTQEQVSVLSFNQRDSLYGL